MQTLLLVVGHPLDGPLQPPGHHLRGEDRPVPRQSGHSVVIEAQSDGRIRCRVISINPSSLTAKARVRARSRPRWGPSSCSTRSRLALVSMRR
ncbi:MAG: hypothetical protein R2909_15455 [Gemmatimonadales bacterium]